MMRKCSVFSALVLIMICFMPVYAQAASQSLLGCTNDFPNGKLIRIDTATGASTLVGALPESMTECVYDALNQKLYAQGADGSFLLYRIDPMTGASLGSVATGAALNGMEFVNGTLYATAIGSALAASYLVTVDPQTGVLAIIGLTGFGPISGLAYDHATGTMYGVLGGGAPAGLITIDLNTGAGSIVGPTGLDRIGSIRFGTDGILYGGLTNNATIFADHLVLINTTTGAATDIGNTGFSITGLALSPPPPHVPAMNEWGMAMLILLTGASSIYLLRRQRKARN
jgi:hypothetical protein